MESIITRFEYSVFTSHFKYHVIIVLSDVVLEVSVLALHLRHTDVTEFLFNKLQSLILHWKQNTNTTSTTVHRPTTWMTTNLLLVLQTNLLYFKSVQDSGLFWITVMCPHTYTCPVLCQWSGFYSRQVRSQTWRSTQKEGGTGWITDRGSSWARKYQPETRKKKILH